MLVDDYHVEIDESEIKPKGSIMKWRV